MGELGRASGNFSPDSKQGDLEPLAEGCGLAEVRGSWRVEAPTIFLGNRVTSKWNSLCFVILYPFPLKFLLGSTALVLSGSLPLPQVFVSLDKSF